jgi:hypothetical protein
MAKEYPPGLNVTDIIPVHLGQLVDVTQLVDDIDRLYTREGEVAAFLPGPEWEQIRDFIRELNR